MTEKELQAISSIDAMEFHVNDWRDATKGKQRGIFSFDDLAAIKIKELKKRIYTDVEFMNPWKMRECIYKDVGEYEYLYEGWKELNVLNKGEVVMQLMDRFNDLFTYQVDATGKVLIKFIDSARQKLAVRPDGDIPF